MCWPFSVDLMLFALWLDLVRVRMLCYWLCY